MASALAPRDSMLDAMGYSRGRFIVEQPGLPILVIPAYAEIERVAEDCRRCSISWRCCCLRGSQPASGQRRRIPKCPCPSRPARCEMPNACPRLPPTSARSRQDYLEVTREHMKV